jgi:hypothetical protein
MTDQHSTTGHRPRRRSDTERVYARHWQAFIAWAVANGIAHPMRPDADDIGLFLLALHETGRAISTIAQARAGIRAHLLAAGHSLPATGDRAVDEVMRHITEAQRDRERERTEPLDMIGVLAVIAGCDDEKMIDLRDRAMIALSWQLCINARRLAAMTVADLTEVHGHPGVLVWLRDNGPEVPLIDRPPLWCPVTWLRAWQQAAGIEAGLLFRPVRHDGSPASRTLSRRCATSVPAPLRRHYGEV